LTAEPNTIAAPCQFCGYENRPGNLFCGMCGAPTRELEAGKEVEYGKETQRRIPADAQHHYHHHYHHHYFVSEAGGQPAAIEPRAAAVPSVSHPSRGRAPVGAFSRVETAVRKLSQDRSLACNTKRLDDLVDLYAADATVLRSNLPPVRGIAPIRELFFTTLEAGLGEVELESLRVEVFGDTAFELGRCTMLAPSASGKRREERGKYVLLAVRQNGEWKILVDCWSSDLSLAEAAAGKPGVPPAKTA